MDAPRVKICGLMEIEDARAVGEAGADYVGAVLAPGTPRAVSPDRAAEIGRASGLPLVLVMVDPAPAEAEAWAQASGASVLQLHGEEPPDQVADLRRRGPWDVWKALRVRRGTDAVERVAAFTEVADGILLDSWHPARPGGTGRSFAWEGVEAVRAAVEERGMGLGVAGGLSPDNVAEAVERLRPSLVDVSSGVEVSPGRKNPQRVRDFVGAVRGGHGAEGRRAALGVGHERTGGAG